MIKKIIVAIAMCHPYVYAAKRTNNVLDRQPKRHHLDLNEIEDDIIDAVSANNLLFIEKIFNANNINDSFGEEGRSLIHLGAEFNKISIVQFALAQGAQIDKQDASQETALMIAAGRASYDIVKYLCQQNAQVNILNENAENVLHIATSAFPFSRRHLDCLSVLMHYNANINAHDDDGNTPLHNLCNKGEKSAIDYLLSNGAMINSQNNEGNTPLHIITQKINTTTVQSLKEHCVSIAQLLLEYNASTSIANSHHELALNIAEYDGNIQLMSLLFPS